MQNLFLTSPDLIRFTADTHFHHRNIMKLQPNRGYDNYNDMTEDYINKWNGEGRFCIDTLTFHLGDFSLGRVSEIKEDLLRLKGDKILVMGNHDKRHSQWWWGRQYWNMVSFGPLVFGRLILTHEPLEIVPEGMVNLHGHNHQHIPMITRSKKEGIKYNVGVDAHNGYPVALHTIAQDIYDAYGVEILEGF